MISLYLMVSKCPTLFWACYGPASAHVSSTRQVWYLAIGSCRGRSGMSVPLLALSNLSTAFPLQTHHLHLAGFLWFLLFVLWVSWADLVCKAGSVEGAVGPSVATRRFVPHRISFKIAMGPTFCIILTPPKYQGGSTRLPAAVCLGDRIVWEERMSHVYWPPLHRWLATCIPCTRPSEPVS